MQTKKKSALRKGWELLLSEFHKCLLPAVPTAHYCDSWNLEPCPFPTRMWSSWQETVVELHPWRSWALPQPQLPPRGRALCPSSHPAWRWSLNSAEIGTSSPGALGNGVQGPPRAATPWLTGRERGWEHPLTLSWSISPPLSHLTVLSAEKGSFSITAVKLISYLHWMDLLQYPLLLKLEPVAWHHLASRIELGSCINCVTCFTLYRPVLQGVYRHSFLCMVPSPGTPEKSSYCTNSFFFFSSWVRGGVHLI